MPNPSNEREWNRRVEMPLPEEGQAVEFETTGKTWKGVFSKGEFKYESDDKRTGFSSPAHWITAWRPIPASPKSELPEWIREELRQGIHYWREVRDLILNLMDPSRYRRLVVQTWRECEAMEKLIVAARKAAENLELAGWRKPDSALRVVLDELRAARDAAKEPE